MIITMTIPGYNYDNILVTTISLLWNPKENTKTRLW